MLDRLLESGIRPDRSCTEVPLRPGRGIGAVEALRGILFHEYAYDGQGNCEAANHVIPTAQNLANLEADMRALVPMVMAVTKASLTRQLEMLVRAYDPCISCSTHVLEL